MKGESGQLGQKGEKGSQVGQYFDYEVSKIFIIIFILTPLIYVSGRSWHRRSNWTTRSKGSFKLLDWCSHAKPVYMHLISITHPSVFWCRERSAWKVTRWGMNLYFSVLVLMCHIESIIWSVLPWQGEIGAFGAKVNKDFKHTLAHVWMQHW